MPRCACSQGLPSGRGTAVYANGCRYVGEFSRGVPHGGRGTLAVAQERTGLAFTAAGEWAAGQLSGPDCTWSLTLGGGWLGSGGSSSTTETYSGGFLRGLRHCQHAAAEFADGTRFEGRFYNGRANGSGVARYADGSVYRGKFVAGLRHGKGTTVLANGSSYAGMWVADERHGQGTLRMPDGREIQGLWQRGALQTAQ